MLSYVYNNLCKVKSINVKSVCFHFELEIYTHSTLTTTYFDGRGMETFSKLCNYFQKKPKKFFGREIFVTSI